MRLKKYKLKKKKMPGVGGKMAEWPHTGSPKWREALAKYSGPEGCQVAAAEWLATTYEGPNRYRGFLGQLIGVVEEWR